MNFFSIFKRNLIFLLKKKIDIDKLDIPYNSIDELFFYFGSDKAYEISLKHQTTHRNHKFGHGFSKFYERHLTKFKKKKIKILEIGSLQGASAAAFVKYFPHAEIYCIDINLRNFKYSSDKINVFGMNSSNSKMMKEHLALKYKLKSSFIYSVPLLHSDQACEIPLLNLLPEWKVFPSSRCRNNRD